MNRTHKLKTAILCLIFVAVAATFLFVLERRIRADAATRASLFSSIDWNLKREVTIQGESPEKLSEEILAHYGRAYEDVFQDGLQYTKKGKEGYLLQEPSHRRISLFDKDRIISTYNTKPSFESGVRIKR